MKKLINGMVLTSVIGLLSACGGGGTGPDNGETDTPTPVEKTASLNQAGFSLRTSTYVYGVGNLQNIRIAKLAQDADQYRYAMLHDGTQRLFMFKGDQNTTLYMYGYNPNTGLFEPGYNGEFTYGFDALPEFADTSSFAMLSSNELINGERAMHLFMRDLKDPRIMYQFLYDNKTKKFVFALNGAKGVFRITGAPADLDWDRWGMLHDGLAYRLYFARANVDNKMYQFALNPATKDYEFGFNSIDLLTIENMPTDSYKENFAMLHDGRYYRFYQLAP